MCPFVLTEGNLCQVNSGWDAETSLDIALHIERFLHNAKVVILSVTSKYPFLPLQKAISNRDLTFRAEWVSLEIGFYLIDSLVILIPVILQRDKVSDGAFL